MSNSFDRPVFIVGAPRSGTTLFQYMLRSHPNISLPTGESHFFIPLLRNEESFGDLSVKQNIRKVLETMYKQSADFLDTDLHGISFDIDRLTEEFHTEKERASKKLLPGFLKKMPSVKTSNAGGTKHPITYYT
jgi:hypothetical protein